jgi:hypothetical protein
MSEARRYSRAVVIVRSVTVECPSCGASVYPDGKVEPMHGQDQPLHTDDRHVRVGARHCSNCWQWFEVPDLSLAFRSLYLRKPR